MKIFVMILLGISLAFGAVGINHASKKELTNIKGIGNKKASSIISYRKVHCFKSVDEIVEVKGLGKKFLEKNKANLKAGSCKKW
jgi:competence protein ComEA